jgi:hypothetical protein
MSSNYTEGDDYLAYFQVYTTKQVKFFSITSLMMIVLSAFYFILDFYFKFYTPKEIEYTELRQYWTIIKIVLIALLVPLCSYTYQRVKFDVMLAFL